MTARQGATKLVGTLLVPKLEAQLHRIEQRLDGLEKMLRSGSVWVR